MISPEQKLFAAALRYLSFRPRSRQEIAKYLLKKSPDANLVQAIVKQLEELGLINDVAFADWYVSSRSRSKPRGQRLLKQELKQKGITEVPPPTQSEEELATVALARKLPAWSKLPFIDFRTKASRFLSSRGFSWDTVEKVVKKSYHKADHLADSE